MTSGCGLPGQPPQVTPPNNRLTRRGCAAGHRRRVGTASGRGGGQPFAALTVGSRAVVNRQTLYDTTVTATNGISVHPAHSLIMRNPTIAGFISPRATQFLASQSPSTPSSPRAMWFSSRDCPRSATAPPRQRRHVRSMLAYAMIRRSWNDAHHHAPSKSCMSAAWLGECVPHRPTRRMEGAPACVAAVARSGRRFGNHDSGSPGGGATSFRDLQPEGFEHRMADADCLKGAPKLIG
jgi:hypothetical protein